MNVDGFNATQAAAAYPPLAQMEMEEFALSNLGVIQSLIPARIQGQLFTHHPQLLETDMQVRMIHVACEAAYTDLPHGPCSTAGTIRCMHGIPHSLHIVFD